MKKIKDFLFQKIEVTEENTEVYVNNEIESNLLVGRIIIVMLFLVVFNLVLGIAGVFTLDISIVIPGLCIVLFIQIPILIINKKANGNLKFAKYGLVWTCVFIVSSYVSMYGSTTILIFAYPMLLSVRYCDVKFARKTVIIVCILSLIAYYNYYYFGEVNLNVFYLEEPGLVFDANVPIVVLGIDKVTYMFRLFIWDYLGNLITLVILAISTVSITKHGRKMIVNASEYTKKTSRLDTELNLARNVQAEMLPHDLPAFPNHLNIDLYAFNTPAKEMGGDFYDYLEIDSDHVAIVMADVSGKGIGAAFFMSIAKSALHYAVEFNLDPSHVLRNTNYYLCMNNTSGLFVTCWLGIYEISSHKLTYANAGHNAPILIRKNEPADYLKGKIGLVLAGMEETTYINNTVELSPGDELVLFTDGVTEALNINKEQFGETRLLKEVEAVKDLDSKEQVESVIATLKDYMRDTEQFDDITMLTMKIND